MCRLRQGTTATNQIAVGDSNDFRLQCGGRSRPVVPLGCDRQSRSPGAERDMHGNSLQFLWPCGLQAAIFLSIQQTLAASVRCPSVRDVG